MANSRSGSGSHPSKRLRVGIERNAPGQETVAHRLPPYNERVSGQVSAATSELPVFTETQILAAIRQAASETAREPGVQTVVLFGSRARGDHDPASDWDIAVVCEDECRNACDRLWERIGAPARHNEINVVPVAASDIREHSDKRNRLESALAKQAVPLAGTWPLSCSLSQRRTQMDFEESLGQHMIVVACIRHCWQSLSDVHDGTNWNDVSKLAIPTSIQAAELLAKEIIAGYDLQPEAVHNLDKLADSLESAPLPSGMRAEDREYDVAAIRAMNGASHFNRLIHYRNHPSRNLPESMLIVQNRVETAMNLQASWIERCLHRGPEWKRFAIEVARIIRKSARDLKFLNYTQSLPLENRSMIAGWGERVTRLIPPEPQEGGKQQALRWSRSS